MTVNKSQSISFSTSGAEDGRLPTISEAEVPIRTNLNSEVSSGPGTTYAAESG